MCQHTTDLLQYSKAKDIQSIMTSFILHI